MVEDVCVIMFKKKCRMGPVVLFVVIRGLVLFNRTRIEEVAVGM